MNSKDKGNLAEAMVIAKLIEAGESVLIPFGDNLRYDVGVDRQGTLLRLQVKTGRIKNGCVEFNCYGTSGRAKSGTIRGYLNEADYFAVYCHSIDEVFYLAVALAPAGKCLLRIDAPIQSHPKIRWARDYMVL